MQMVEALRRVAAYLGGWGSGSFRRAVTILLLAHIGVVVVAWAGWAFFLLPTFVDSRIVPAFVMWSFAVVVSLTLVWLFGMWGTVASGGAGVANDGLDSLPVRAQLGLGFLRWAMQLIMISGVFAAAVATQVDLRWWHIFGTAEIRSLPGRVATVPIPSAWRLVSVDHGDDGGNHHPNAGDWRRYEVPAGYSFADLKSWLSSKEWTSNPTGHSFGRIQVVNCNAVKQTCHAQLVPPAGQHPDFFVRVERQDPSTYNEGVAEVDVQVTYRQYVEPRWEVPGSAVSRGRAIPVPATWTLADEDSSNTDSGQSFIRTFGVPESFTVTDLKAWLTGRTFSHPDTGAPFGALALDGDCRHFASGSDACYAVVADSRYISSHGISTAQDFVEASLDNDDHTVRVEYRHTDRD